MPLSAISETPHMQNDAVQTPARDLRCRSGASRQAPASSPATHKRANCAGTGCRQLVRPPSFISPLPDARRWPACHETEALEENTALSLKLRQIELA
eukprot:1302964-Pleurochrysis_carterae.AAC.2